VLLTNRVHEARARRPAKVISDVRADLADAAALAVTDYADGPMVMPAKFRADRAVDWNRPERRSRRHATSKKKSSHAKSGSHASASKASASKSSASKSSASGKKKKR
jgi:hypothetical protein